MTSFNNACVGRLSYASNQSNLDMLRHFLHAQLFAGQLDSLDSVCDLLERNVPRGVWRAMLWLDVDAEGTEAAVVR